MDSEPKYSSFQVADMLGIGRGTFQDYMKREFIKPQIRSTNKGNRNKFTLWNIIQSKVFLTLFKTFGLPRQSAGEIAFSLEYKWLKSLLDTKEKDLLICFVFKGGILEIKHLYVTKGFENFELPREFIMESRISIIIYDEIEKFVLERVSLLEN